MKQLSFNVFLVLSFLILYGLLSKESQGQEHVFTKSISKSIEVAQREIVIDAEKANITIAQSNDENFIMDIKFISRHTNKQIAEQQLAYLKHVLNIKSKEVYLRNYILVSAGEELTGSIQAEYLLKVPKNKTIRIKNSLGNIIIENMEGNFILSTKYGNVTLNNVRGELKLFANIGELLVKDSRLSSTIETKYMNSYFYNNSGAYKLISNLGSLNFNINKNITNLDIDASGTEITLLNKSCHECNLNLITYNGNIFIDACNIPLKSCIQMDSRKIDKDKKEFVYFNPKVKSNINVINKFANISIQ